MNTKFIVLISIVLISTKILLLFLIWPKPIVPVYVSKQSYRKQKKLHEDSSLKIITLVVM